MELRKENNFRNIATLNEYNPSHRYIHQSNLIKVLRNVRIRQPEAFQFFNTGLQVYNNCIKLRHDSTHQLLCGLADFVFCQEV